MGSDGGSDGGGDDGMPMGPEGYGNCVDIACLETEQCVVRAEGTRVVCSYQDCEETEDCTTPPPGGNPTVRCSQADEDEGGECLMFCNEGEACPDGMECVNNQICMWSYDQTMHEGFADCLGDDAVPCLPGETCVTDAEAGMDASYNVCTYLGCETVEDCPLPPEDEQSTAQVVCGERLEYSDMGECFLDCSEGQVCPQGMVCAGDALVCVHDV